jgi:hypothetical protein
MSLLTVVNDVCAVVGVHAPTAGVIASTNTDRSMFEMLALANEMAQRIATDVRDWNMLRKSATFVGGTGVPPIAGDPTVETQVFNMPDDYRRMLIGSNVWRSPNTITPMRFVPNTDEWFQRRFANYAAPWGEWTLIAGQMHIWPIMAAAIAGPPAVAAVKARFSYLDKNPIATASAPTGPFAERFVSDTDVFRLPERLLKLGMVWQWKANKGSPYAEDMGTWSDAMANAMGADAPSPIIIGSMPSSSASNVAYPFPIDPGMVPL